MGQTTKEMNKIAGLIIGVSSRVIIYALVILLLYQGVVRGYEFGHEIFYTSAVAVLPGTDKEVTIEEGTTVSEAAKMLRETGLISNEYAFIIQSKFYDYEINPGTYTLNTSMTSKEILQKINENKQEEEDGDEKR